LIRRIIKSNALPFSRIVDVQYLKTLLAHIKADRLPVESTIPSAPAGVWTAGGAKRG
jgi:hypothetical protein